MMGNGAGMGNWGLVVLREMNFRIHSERGIVLDTKMCSAATYRINN